jgi:hypothetical protein
MRPERKFRSVAKAALAGLLALLFLVASAFSVSPSLHHWLHHHDAGGHQTCLACSLSHGQVGAAEVASVAVALIFALICGALLQLTSPRSSFDYRLSPSRAPPSFFSDLR